MGLNNAWMKWAVHRAVQGRTRDIREMAVREWVVCPSENKMVQPAIFPSGALERIKSLSPWRAMESELVLVNGGLIEHAATTAHQVENVYLADSFVYHKAAKLRAGFGKEQHFGAHFRDCQDISVANLVASWTGASFFGNFLQDTFPLEMIPDNGARLLGAATKPYSHEAGYRALCGLPSPEKVPYARIRQLVLYTDFAQNAYKEARYRLLRERVRASIGPSRPVQKPGIYIRRGATGEPRILENEAALETILSAHGFDIIDPTELGAEEIANRSLDARIIVGVEGSHLSHGSYSVADDGAFLVIQPPHRFAMPYKEFADRMGMRFGFVVGIPSERGFAVDINEILRTLEQL